MQIAEHLRGVTGYPCVCGHVCEVRERAIVVPELVGYS
jgi:hypothetical protein